MKQLINKLTNYTTALVLILFIVSCNDDDNFTYDIPEQADVANVSLNVSTSALSQCIIEASITTVDENVTVYYVFGPSSWEVPSSSQVFELGDSIEFDQAGTKMITLDDLSFDLELDGSYVLYAITVNKDGLRSESVTVKSYSHVSDYEINIDSSYSGESIVGGTIIGNYPITLTPTSNPNEYTVDTLWGANFVADGTGNPAFAGSFVYSGTLTINSDLSITVVGDAPWALGGEGVYNPCSNVITYTLEQILFGNPSFTVDVTLTPDNL